VFGENNQARSDSVREVRLLQLCAPSLISSEAENVFAVGTLTRSAHVHTTYTYVYMASHTDELTDADITLT